MPYAIRKVGKKFQVVNTATGEVHAKGTTKKKAEAQIRLLGSKEGGGPKRQRSPSPPPTDPRQRQVDNLTNTFNQLQRTIGRYMQERNQIDNSLQFARDQLFQLRNPTPEYIEHYSHLSNKQMLDKEENYIDELKELEPKRIRIGEIIRRTTDMSFRISDQINRLQQEIDEASGLNERIRTGEVFNRPRRNTPPELENISPNESDEEMEGGGPKRRLFSEAEVAPEPVPAIRIRPLVFAPQGRTSSPPMPPLVVSGEPPEFFYQDVGNTPETLTLQSFYEDPTDLNVKDVKKPIAVRPSGSGMPRRFK